LTICENVSDSVYECVLGAGSCPAIAERLGFGGDDEGWQPAPDNNESGFIFLYAQDG
jgi:hypothetical protein